MSKIKSLTSLTQIEFDNLYDFFHPLMEQKVLHYTLKGKRRKVPLYKESKLSSLQGSKSKLKFILTYLKEHPTQIFMAYYYKISQSKVSEWISFILLVLLDALKKIGVAPQRGSEFSIPNDLEYILCDVTEREVNRSTDYQVQKEEYSGKKKTHTVKNLAFSDGKGYIHYLGVTYEGSVHDKTLWDQIKIKNEEINILVDLGFLGVEHDYENVIIPYKKPKNKELKELQKQINKGIASTRVKTEHAFAGIKRLKIVKQKINLKGDDIRDRLMSIATALHNLRVQFRQLRNKP